MKNRRAVLAVSAAGAVLSLGVHPTAAAAASATSTESVRTPTGLTLTVTPMRLPSAGGTVRVRGAGFDPTVGIYVALCVTPRAGQQPGPCGGGVNTAGTSPASAWISSNPPPYGAALATPYRVGGRFSVRLTLSPMIGDVDCRISSCSVVTRADHTRAADRRFDVAVPIRFDR